MRDIRRYLPIACFGIVIIALVVFLWHVPWQAIRSVFLLADGRWIGAAFALTFLNVTLRGLALRALISPAARISILRSIRYILASITASIIAPLRAGDALRAWLLIRYEGITVPACAGIYMCEKVGDVTSLIILSAPLPWLVRELPRWTHWSFGLLAVVLILSAALLMAARKTSWGSHLRGRIAPIGASNTLAPAALAIFAVWVVDMLAIMTVLHAVAAPCSAPIAAFVLLAVNLAISVPAPANGGTLEFGAVMSLQVLGVDPGKAIAFAVLYHAAQVLPVMVLGLWDGPMLWQTDLLARSHPGKA